LQPYQVGQLCALGLLASLMMIQSAKIEKLRVKNELATTRETLEMAAEMKVYDRKKLPRLKLKQQK
jgi:hypothetical protein